MNIVIDANILIAALLKNGKIRELIVNSPHRLLVPDIHFQEIEEHKEELLEKSKLSAGEFATLISTLSNYFSIIESNKILFFLEEAEELIGTIDKDDVPIIATALAYNCSIWSDDKHFLKQNKIKIFKTSDIMNMTEE
ncbi:MAG: PIN domain-containing protein [Nanoarchaeota archaeon]|nr:PIN domain-containing protein [Nanoarchaeota archaeon]